MPQSGKTSILTSPCAPAATGGDLRGLGVPSTGSGQALEGLLCRARACVQCHSKPADDPTRNPLPDFTLIPDRPPQTIQTHRMTGVRDEAFMRASVAMTVTATQGTDGVLAGVAITNVGAGHHIPTDSPMRNMILVVSGRDAQGNALPYLGDQVVPEWGGTDRETFNTQSLIPNYAGLPGRGFAKVLEVWDGTAPAPQWRNGVRILSDNRIAARAKDVSHYAFGFEGSQDITVEARLIFRRPFKPWADAKGRTEPNLVMAQTTVKADRSNQPLLASQKSAIEPVSFAPSPATTADGGRLSSAELATPSACTTCHDRPASGWMASGHAEATTSPLYRAWFKAADQDTQGRISPFCAGCHTPTGLLSGQIRSRWAWSSRELYPLDAQAQTGVSCTACHSVSATTGAGNGAYVIDPDAPSCPQYAARDPQHAVRQPPASNTQYPIPAPTLCAACHEATNPATGLPVMTTYSEWQRSRFNTGDPATTKTCQDCHFAAGRHGELRPDDLKEAAAIRIVAPAQAEPFEELALEVQVANAGAGHDLPTGAAELRQVWLSLAVTDAAGREIYRSGQTDEYGDPVQGTITYGTAWQNAQGQATDRLWEAARPLRDHRIPAGATVTETYRLALSREVRDPLTVRAVLNYRAAAGYLSSLMAIYLGGPVPSAPVIEMAADETIVPLR